jgi:hypothetical protein
MLEFQLKGIFYNYDEKYFPGHKCEEHKIFMAIFEDVFDEEVESPLVKEIPPTDNTTMSLIHQKLNH